MHTNQERPILHQLPLPQRQTKCFDVGIGLNQFETNKVKYLAIELNQLRTIKVKGNLDSILMLQKISNL